MCPGPCEPFGFQLDDPMGQKDTPGPSKWIVATGRLVGDKAWPMGRLLTYPSGEDHGRLKLPYSSTPTGSDKGVGDIE